MPLVLPRHVDKRRMPSRWSPGVNIDCWEYTDGLAGCWPMWDGGGDKAMDLSGNGNTGTLTLMAPATDWIASEHGPCLDFDGDNDYVNVGDVPALDLIGELSIALRIFHDDQGTFGYYVSKTNFSGAGGYGLYHLTNAIVFAAGSSVSRTSNAVFPGATDEWRHIVVTASAAGVAFYKNGLPAGTGAGVTITANALSFVIGVRDVGGIYNVRAKIQDVRVYDHVLSAAEAWHIANDSQLYRQPRFPWGALPGGGAPPSFIAYPYPLHDLQGGLTE